MVVCVIAEQCVMAISEGEVLEQRLQSMTADSRGELEGRGLPNGSPAVLIICAAAMSCVNIGKKLPNLNKVRLLPVGVTSSCKCIPHAARVVAQAQTRNISGEIMSLMSSPCVR